MQTIPYSLIQQDRNTDRTPSGSETARLAHQVRSCSCSAGSSSSSAGTGKPCS